MKSNEMKAITPKQEKAIAALVSTSTIKDAAESAGVTTVTLWRWLQLPEFAAAWRAARRQVVENAITQLQTAATQAVETLKRNLHCGNEAVEVRAASIILEQAVKGVELVDLQERVERLESLLEEKGKKKWA